MNDTQEYILQKSIDNLIKMVDKLNKDLETVSKESDHYHSMYIKYKQMYNDLLFHDIETKDPKPRTKVYVLKGWQRGAWQPEILWMGIFLSMEAAEKQMQEYKKEGLNVAGMHIEEHEVEQ